MLVLIGIGLAAGLITSFSPCVLPVLPILLAGGVAGRRPLRIVAGLVASFTVFTLFASWLLRKVGLPQDFLRNLAIALLFVVAATLLFPTLGRLAERPFLRLTRRSGNDHGGGLLLGASLGLVFVPCAGPVLAAVTVVAANQNVGWRALVLTLAYAVGAAIPMLLIALGGRGLATTLRAQGAALRQAAGIVLAFTALLIAFHVDERFTTALPGYTTSLQNKVERSARASRELGKVRGARALAAEKAGDAVLPDYGQAPELVAGGAWINSPPLTMKQLRGKVVLVDFWTYSCINCLRTLPHLRAWNARYAKDGLVVVGVHSPEFAFEHKRSNVEAAVRRLAVHYPVMQDNDYATWNGYANQYWPAEYLVDRDGHVRHAHFGEGEYAKTERLIQRLLGMKQGAVARVADPTPTGIMTPETYLGWQRIDNYVGTPITKDRPGSYAFPLVVPDNSISYAGRWNVEAERALPLRDARLRLHFSASKVYIVLGGHGRVDALVNGKPVRRIRVTSDRLYTVVDTPRAHDGLLELRFTPGVEAYSFTFG